MFVKAKTWMYHYWHFEEKNPSLDTRFIDWPRTIVNYNVYKYKWSFKSEHLFEMGLKEENVHMSDY